MCAHDSVHQSIADVVLYLNFINEGATERIGQDGNKVRGPGGHIRCDEELVLDVDEMLGKLDCWGMSFNIDRGKKKNSITLPLR